MTILQAQKSQPAATIIVDHHSAVSYAHLQKSTNAEENVEVTVAFERLLNTKLQRVV
jgi:hypothetical protein